MGSGNGQEGEEEEEESEVGGVGEGGKELAVCDVFIYGARWLTVTRLNIDPGPFSLGFARAETQQSRKQTETAAD
jgi:hypothetical protein